MLHADNAWTFLYDKTICIFNGEGLKAPIEELNILVRLLMDRWPHESLVAKVRELVHDGHSILRAKLSNLTEETVLHRLAAMWVFFQTNVLPYLQGVFLPLSTDEANSNRLGLGGLSNAPSVSDISGGSVGNPGSTSNTVSGSAAAAVARSLTQSRHQAAGSGTIRSVVGMFTSSPSSSPDLNAVARSAAPTITAGSGRFGASLALDGMNASFAVDIKQLVLLEFRNAIAIPHLQAIEGKSSECCILLEREFPTLLHSN